MLAEAALDYARRGWSVIPVHSIGRRTCTCGRPDCASPGKHPRVAWSEATEEAASEAQVQEWWRRWPDANVGVVTGRVSGVVVLDVDPRNGGEESLTDLVAEFGELPATLASRTGGGGRHLWFAAPPWSLPSVELAPGIDLKGEGGMVVAPPSRHASGTAYAWKDPNADLAELPDWVSHRVRHPEFTGASSDPTPPFRTSAEQEEFASAWAETGIELLPGDRYYLCPFHDDHHPSLHIDAEGCRWYCFGCGRGGGIGALKRLLGEPAAPPPRARLQGSLGDGPVTLEGHAEVEVVGESEHQDEILELTGGQRRYGGVDVEAVASLHPRFEGVEVRIHDLPVGYMAPADAARFAGDIEDSISTHDRASCRARIRGGWDRGGDDVGLFGVVLYLGDEED